jgi:hypothetical protein
LVDGQKAVPHGSENGYSKFINTFTLQQVETLLKPYAIELLEEEEHLGTTTLGKIDTGTFFILSPAIFKVFNSLEKHD